MVLLKQHLTARLIAFAALAVLATACNPFSPGSTPAVTRAATQTPWIIYVPVTSTPEPATITPLPTVPAVVVKAATRTPTRPAAVTKPTVAPTKPAAPPVAAGPSATPVPACAASSVSLLFPKDGDPRRTKADGPGSDTFRFQWTPFQPFESDPLMGYRIDIVSRRGNSQVNGDAVYVGHNWFLANGQTWVYDARRVYNLAAPAGGDSVVVTWKVTVIKTTGGFDNQGGVSGTVVNCSPPSANSTINLLVD